MLFLCCLILLQVSVLAKASENTYIVKADNVSSNCSIQDYLCLTLDDYASNQSEFFTSNSTFLFLPGTHTTRTVVNLVNVSNIVLQGFDSDPNLYRVEFSIEFVRAVNITTQGLTLRFTGEKNDTVLSFIDSRNVLIMFMIFQGNVQYQIRAVLLKHSIATFKNCTFKQNTGVQFGGAIFIRELSKAIVLNSFFIGNTALLKGGAAYVEQSEFWVSESIFVNNSAVKGGGIFCLGSLFIASSAHFFKNLAAALVFRQSKANFTGTSIFKENTNTVTAFGAGGALIAVASTVLFLGCTLFQDNYAYVEGGAIAGLIQTKIVFTGNTKFINNNYSLFRKRRCHCIDSGYSIGDAWVSAV